MKLEDLTKLIRLEIEAETSSNPFRESVLWGCSVTGFLFFFRPFGMSNEDLWYLFATSAGYGSITIVMLFLNQAWVRKHIRRFFKDPWTVKREIVHLLLIILQVGLLNFLYASLLLAEFPFSLMAFLRILIYTASLLILIFFVKHALALLISYRSEKTILETKLAYFKELKEYAALPQKEESLIKLRFENEEIELAADRIILITAWGNYIKLLMDVEEGKVELVNRGRIKDIENQLASHPNFQRCHRSYIVNTNFILRVSGNSKTAFARLKKNDITVPIARDKIKSYLTKYSG